MHATRGTAAIPSLLADEAGARNPAARFGLLAELEGQGEARRNSPARLASHLRKHRWRAAAAACALVVLVLALLVPGPPVRQGGVDGHRDAMPSELAPGPVAPRGHPAVILDDPPRSREVAGEGLAGGVEGSRGDPMQMLREDVVPAAAPVARRRPPARADSDVDLLAALVHHAGRMSPGADATAAPLTGPAPAPTVLQANTSPDVPGQRSEAVSQALARCPAANTEPGLSCRQAACTGRWGEHPSCPRPTVPAAQPR